MARGASWRQMAATASVLLLAACGQKGAPLAPLHLVPAAVTELSVKRLADAARLQFVLPTRNANGPGRLELERVEIYAITVPHGVAPANRDLVTKERLVGEVQVRPAPVEGEPAPEPETPAAPDPRPGPGDTVTFVDVLTPEKLTPVILAPPATPAAAGPAAAGGPGTTTAPAPVTTPDAQAPETTPTPPAAGAQAPAATPAPPADAPVPAAPPSPPADAAAPVAPTTPPADAPAAPAATAVPAPAAKPAPAGEPSRIYIVRGVTRSGRPGAASTRVVLPVLPVPPPPAEVRARVTEAGIVLEWTPNAKAPTASFNVYSADEPAKPVNPALLKEPSFEQANVPLGEERCYRVRSVGLVGDVALEGELSEPACATPADTFPPSAPTGLAVVPTPGQISLIWDANPEKDVAGYVVLRGNAPDGPLQPLTPAPIRETSYRDTTVNPGARYIYAIVAVDTATPANTSPQSPRVEETAR